jgi:S1/P1 Nuclease
VIHFVGDLHMPLHATTNNDEGGNCVALRYFRRRPHEHHGSYAPNLHALWDTAIPERDMEGADPAEYAEMLENQFGGDVESWQKAGVRVEDWAWESHDLAESVVYRELTPKIPVEQHAAVHSCADANHIGERMLQLHIFAGQTYQDTAGAVVEERLAQGGVRLAMMLNEAAKTAK